MGDPSSLVFDKFEKIGLLIGKSLIYIIVNSIIIFFGSKVEGSETTPTPTPLQPLDNLPSSSNLP